MLSFPCFSKTSNKFHHPQVKTSVLSSCLSHLCSGREKNGYDGVLDIETCHELCNYFSKY